MKFNTMVRALQIAIEEIVKDNELIRLLSNNNDKPLDIVNLDNSSIFGKNLFLEPFNLEVPQEQKVELRIFYPNGTFDKSNSLGVSDIYFQIIEHRDLERIKIGNKLTLRSFEIMERLIKIFQKESFSVLGTVLFKSFDYSHINKDYGMYTLVAEVMFL